MRVVDVNVLVYAHRPESPRARPLPRLARDGAGRQLKLLGLSDLVLSGFLRVVTHPRIFREPTPLATALDFAEALLASPAATQTAPGDRHWTIFTDLCRRVDARGNVVPDAFLAALAIEHGAALVTADRSFGRVSGFAGGTRSRAAPARPADAPDVLLRGNVDFGRRPFVVEGGNGTRPTKEARCSTCA